MQGPGTAVEFEDATAVEAERHAAVAEVDHGAPVEATAGVVGGGGHGAVEEQIVVSCDDHFVGEGVEPV